MPDTPSYVLITPARNEAAFIEMTLKSVVEQTLRPLKWVIVSDGSTDGTDDLVREYEAKNPWIELARMPERSERNFAGKVHAFNAGYARVKDLPFDVVASLDADISFVSDYFEFLLRKLANEAQLGLVGTPFLDGSKQAYDYRFVSIEHVSGACQVFRRSCFEQIGGYVPVKGGGIDHIAVMTARMLGWKTRTFTERNCIHHRAMGTAEHSTLRARFRTGTQDYILGSHPLWHTFRTAYQMTRRPFILGGIALGAGYFQAMARGARRSVSPELMRFRRAEQLRRLKRFFSVNVASPASGSVAAINSADHLPRSTPTTHLQSAMIPTRLDSKTLISPPASPVSGPEGASVDGRREPAGALIINADDWGRDRETTQRIFACILHGSVSSTSAMVFMEDSERAAEIALEQGIDAGLHFNFTTPFSGRNCPRSLLERQRELTVYLRRRRSARLFFHPGLARSFEYVVKAQLEAFYGLYGVEPKRVDGHHHMHLCANVLLGKLLPEGTFARRTFSRCRPTEGLGRSIYRHVTDRIIARRHCLTDFFFSLMPFEPAGHLEHVCGLARSFTVEVETHPINAEEYRFLTGPDIFRRLKDVPIAAGFLPGRRDQQRLHGALAQARGN